MPSTIPSARTPICSSQLSSAVDAFYDDLKLMGVDNRVAAMTFSEFGRRIMSNASGGTDHGTAEPVMVFGPGVNPGIIGSSPVIPANATVNDNLAMQNDYRSIYASVLSDWFGVSPTVLSNVMLAPYPILPIFKKIAGVEETTQQGSTELLGQCYPNPVRSGTTITFSSTGSAPTTIQLFDANGRLVRTLAQGSYPAVSIRSALTAAAWRPAPTSTALPVAEKALRAKCLWTSNCRQKREDDDHLPVSYSSCLSVPLIIITRISRSISSAFSSSLR